MSLYTIVDKERIEAGVAAETSAAAREYLNRPPLLGNPSEWARRFDDLPYLPERYSPFLKDVRDMVQDVTASAAAVRQAGFAQRNQAGLMPHEARALPRKGLWTDNQALPPPELVRGEIVRETA